MFGGDEFGGIGLPNGTLTGVHGTAGTGNAGDAGVSQGGQHAESADQLVRLLGGEAPLLSVLQKLDVPSLRNLKANGKRWRNRCRTALCSAAWAEIARGGHSLDLGITRHWLPEERCSACKFLSDGQCSRLSELKADGFVAQLQPLLSREHLDSHALLQSLTVNPTSEASDAAGRGIPDADALAAQSEFCALLAMWVLGSSAVLGRPTSRRHIQRLAANAPCSRACCRAWHAPQPHVAYRQLEQKCTARSRPCRHAAAAAVARRERGRSKQRERRRRRQ